MNKLALFLIVPFLLSIYSGKGQNKIEQAYSIHKDLLFEIYKDLHANPELSFYEENSAQKLYLEFEKNGAKATKNVGGFGVVGVLKNGEGPVIMVRADMDALPITEQTGVEYASKRKVTSESGQEVGVMHACGHDIHMTVLTGVARVMSDLKSEWSGTLILVGQPAEEKGMGALKMFEDGLFDKFPKPDYALALHTSASHPAGKIAYCKENALASVDWLDIKVKGKGGHGAYPHRTVDPVVLSARIIMALQTIVSREVAPTDAAVVTVGSIHGGTKHNIIPDEVDLQLTIRSYSMEVRDNTIAAIRRIVNGVAASAGLSEEMYPEVIVGEGNTPPTYNDPQLTEQVVSAASSELGEENVVSTGPVMGGEDFSYYGIQEHKVPICIYWLGAVENEIYNKSLESGEKLPSLHSPKFMPDPEPTIETGVRSMVSSLLSLYNKK